jgi:hypothetical protein
MNTLQLRFKYELLWLRTVILFIEIYNRAGEGLILLTQQIVPLHSVITINFLIVCILTQFEKHKKVFYQINFYLNRSYLCESRKFFKLA